MNFLQLCQKVARDSGTINGSNQPAAVTGQSGRLAKVVEMTAEAYRRIQVQQGGRWRWLREDFSTTVITAGTSRYTPTGSFGLSRFASWIGDDLESGYRPVTLYKTSLGVSDEGELRQIEYQWWKRTYDRGTQNPNRPIEWAIGPDGDLCLGPVPDDSYTLRGEYWKGPQTLEANNDTPEMPERFHDVIAWWAQKLLAGHDEAQIARALAVDEVGSLWFELVNGQTEAVTIGGGPLA